MSSTTTPPSSANPPGVSPSVAATFMTPAQKGIVCVIGVVALGGLGLLVSGKIDVMSKKEPAKYETALIKDMTIAPLTTPKIIEESRKVTDRDDRRKQRDDDEPLARGILSNRGGGGSGGAIREASDKTLKDTAADMDPLERSLVPSKFEGTSVVELPDPTYTIAHGRILQCKQQTKMNSTLAGGVTATLGEIRSDTSDVTLLDKGATVFGTIQHALLNGEDRLAVLWQDVSTPILYDDRGKPHRFRVTVDSPFSSELGETGADGDVNRHLGSKIGALLGYSFIQAGTQYAVQSASKQDRGGSQINLNSFQQGGDQSAQIFLSDIVRRPDVMTRDEGLPCSIFLMRDLNLRKAYTLRMKYRTHL